MLLAGKSHFFLALMVKDDRSLYNVYVFFGMNMLFYDGLYHFCNGNVRKWKIYLFNNHFCHMTQCLEM